MAVIEVKERTSRRRSTRRGDKRTHDRVWLVVCDDIHDGTAVALNAAGIPNDGDSHPQDGDAELVTVDASPIGNDPFRFEVLAKYETPDNDNNLPSGADSDTHPLDRPWDIQVTGSEVVQAYFRDRSPKPTDWNEEDDGPWTGKPVATSAGNPFDVMPERDASELQIEITRNEAARDIATDAAWSNRVNADAVVIDGTTFAPGTLKLSPITSSRVVEQWTSPWGLTQTVTYYRYTYRLRARVEGWDDVFEDRDYVELAPVLDDDDLPVLDDDGEPVREVKEIKIEDEETGEQVPIRKPWPLDGKGAKKEKPDAQPATLTFRPYWYRDFAPLNFG